MSSTPSGARVALASEGSVNVATGCRVDHLVGELARAGRFKIALEVAPDSTDEACGGRGGAGPCDRREFQAGVGWALMRRRSRCACAGGESEPRLVTNAGFSDFRVGGVANDVPSRFLASS